MQGEIDSMNISVSAYFDIEAKDNMFFKIFYNVSTILFVAPYFR